MSRARLIELVELKSAANQAWPLACLVAVVARALRAKDALPCFVDLAVFMDNSLGRPSAAQHGHRLGEAILWTIEALSVERSR